MTPVELIEALAAELREASKDFKYLAEGQPQKKITVYEQGVPQEEFANDSFYPLIAVELIAVNDSPECTSIASVLLTVATYHGERRRDYWREHLNLCECVRQYLLGHRTIGKRFTLTGDLYHGVVEPQSESFMFSNFFAQFYIAHLLPSVPQPIFPPRD